MDSAANSIFAYFDPDYPTLVLTVTGLVRIYCIIVEGLQRPFARMNDNSDLGSLERNAISQQASLPVPGYSVVNCADPTKRKGLCPIPDGFLLEGQGGGTF
jgi:hypothetical protein